MNQVHLLLQPFLFSFWLLLVLVHQSRIRRLSGQLVLIVSFKKPCVVFSGHYIKVISKCIIGMLNWLSGNDVNKQ